MPVQSQAGNKGEKIRSDCFVQLEIRNEGGIQIEIQSKVKSLYGESIESLVKIIFDFFGIRHGHILIEDSGALDFVIAARIEAAIRKIVHTSSGYIFPVSQENRYESEKERFRFSRLYLPGNTPSMMINAGIHHPDGIILDLEDSVAPQKKHEARFLVRNVLCKMNFYGAERMVRINQIPAGFDDLYFIVPFNPHVILVPKCESASQINKLEKEIEKIRSKSKKTINKIFLMPIIETALGVENAFEIAAASDNIIGLAIGLEDYTADIGAVRTLDARESFYARTRIVNACKAARIQAIDSVFSDVDDEKGLKDTVRNSKSLGFEGMGCIHPRQIPIIHEGYAPETREIEKAEKVVNAYIEAEERGLGVVSLGSKMIDPPVVKRAQKTLDLAMKLGLIHKNWRDKYVS